MGKSITTYKPGQLSRAIQSTYRNAETAWKIVESAVLADDYSYITAEASKLANSKGERGGNSGKDVMKLRQLVQKVSKELSSIKDETTGKLKHPKVAPRTIKLDDKDKGTFKPDAVRKNAPDSSRTLGRFRRYVLQGMADHAQMELEANGNTNFAATFNLYGEIKDFMEALGSPEAKKGGIAQSMRDQLEAEKEQEKATGNKKPKA